MRYRYLLIVASLLIAITVARPASAILPFYNALKKDYLDKLEDKKFAEEVNKASNRCFMCHQGKNRKNHNVMGVEVAKLLDKKKDAKDTEKISASIKKVLEMHVDPKDDKSETYLDRLNASKWPAGNLEDLQKEPKDSEEKQE
jgi:cytochrome c2